MTGSLHRFAGRDLGAPSRPDGLRLLLPALAVALVACGGGPADGEPEQEEAREAAARDSVVTVRTSALDLAGLTEVRPRPGTLARTATLAGRLEVDPAGRSVVRAPAPGRFRLEVTSGDRVAAADTLGWLESPETYPDSLPLTAPADGRLVDLPSGPAGLVDGWAPLATVASTGTLRVVVPVPPDRYGEVREGTVLTLTAGQEDGSGDTGRRVRVRGFLPPDGDAGHARATARVPNRDGRLEPGMRVTVSVPLGDSLSGHWLPDPSVLYDRQRPDRTVVFLRRGDGYVQVPVEVGGRTSDSVFVTSGVDRRDTVVAQGSYQLLYADFSFRGIGAEAGEMEEGEEDEGGP